MPKNQGAPSRAGNPTSQRNGAAKKPRWSSDQRVAKGRAAERPRGGELAAERSGGGNHSAGRSGNRAERRAGLQWSDRRSASSSSSSSAERRPRPEGATGESRRPNWEPRTGGSRAHGDRPVQGRGPRPMRDGSSRDGQYRDGQYRDGQQRDSQFRDAPRRDGQFRDAPRRDGQFRDAARPAYRETRVEERPRFTPADDVVHERLEATSIDSSVTENGGFAELGLGDNIVRALQELGASAPFPIQSGTIPAAIAGQDVLGRGRTGSGKTIAFGAPLVERLLQLQKGSNERRKPGRAPRALVLAPTRELALQIDATVQPIARSVGLFTTQIYGGVPFARQLGALDRGVDIIVGTPGRIQDLANRGALDLSAVEITVLDEADHMAELGFVEPVRELLRMTKEGGQRLLFSATLDAAVQSLIEEFLVDPAIFEVAGEDQASSTIDHRVLLIDHRDKLEILTELVAASERTIVFTRTRAYAEQLSDHFDDQGVDADAIHGDLAQARRQRALDRFSRGRTAALVATDVAARGIHVDDVELVIQADAPDEHKAYLHRSGRTGRAGRSGTVVTLVPRNRRRRLEELLDRAGITATWIPVRPGEAAAAVATATA